MNDIIYTRVSTDEQAEKGFSLRHQKEMLEKYCAIKGSTIVKHYQDDYSAKDFNRPQWRALEIFVKANKKDVDRILFTKWDRFSRNQMEAYRVIKLFKSWGIEVNSTEQPLDLDNPDNKAMLALYLVMPEVENDKISQRTKEGIVRARKEGAYTSKAPLGYDNAKTVLDISSLIPNHQSDFVREIFNEVAKDIKSVEQVRLDFVKKGYKGVKQSFYNLLRNKVYIGMVMIPAYKKDEERWISGLHESIIDSDVFHTVQNILAGKHKNTRHPAKRHELLPLRGFLKCEYCDGNLTGSISEGNGGKYGYYHCKNGCKNRIPSPLAHDLFEGVLLGYRMNKNAQECSKAILKDIIKDNQKGEEHKILQLNKQITELHENIVKLEDKLVAGSLEDVAFGRINKRYNDKLMDLKAELLEKKTEVDSPLKYVNGAIDSATCLLELFQDGDYDEQIHLLGSLFPNMLVISKDACRTIKPNEAIELLCRISEDYKGSRNKKTTKNGGLSSVAPSPGLEPGTP